MKTFNSLLRIPGRPNLIAGPKLKMATGFFEQLRGLLFREGLLASHGFMLAPCRCVHTIGMRCALDLIFVDCNGVVRRIETNIGPMRAAGCSGAHATIELAAGSADRLGIVPGGGWYLVCPQRVSPQNGGKSS